MPEWFAETLHAEFRQHLRIDRVIYRCNTNLQEILIFENSVLGRVLVLDGVVQTTEADEFIYHEMLTHVPIIAHGFARRVLVVGGGDGGMIEEALKYHCLEQVVMVEVDRSVVDICKKYLPTLSQGAFDDPRLQLVISDGSEYVSKTKQRFDVIIIDSPDPVGPAVNLFSDKFYQDCRLCLNPGGVLVAQNGVPFVQAQGLRESARRLSDHFADVTFFRASVPTYYGGDMAFGWATDDVTLRTLSIGQLRTRFSEENLNTRHYSPEIHLAAFAIPPWVDEVLTNK
tara:strand:- start:117 stop:971 length:855 start_codon:yes stop_codon:yes gene_type:complete